MTQTIKLSGTIYNLQDTTGKILSTDKNLETKVSGGGGGGFSRRGTGFNAPVRVTSTTTVHDEIFIEDVTGKEHSYQLSGFNLACREGNTITVLAALKQNKSNGPYFAVINHSTDKTYFNKSAIAEICAPNKFLLLGLIVLAAIIASSAFPSQGIIVLIVAVIAAFIYYFVTLNSNTQLLKNAVSSASYKD